ncbi:MerR family transcriptional regulator [Alkalihalobacillus trypoxylicola]|uniref:HTH merR-type domain-containing protein n=1 Tax=Alkalihalobacillus trypoxylicola TaxID=519424 RepID=A0A162E719_9BACI|nr:MerR family transcriptional regulator [Alkalihalobacillus trypoxylicola]KYG31926.1 hypothetical protein AZF04_03885 [Alkalihalobacillus trypoxylicola]
MKDDYTYRTGQLLNILGVSRDTLRYYEEQGILKPNQTKSNNYRQYDYYDLYTIMVADFYKKRNFSIKEIKRLQDGFETDDLINVLDKKEKELNESIRLSEMKLKKIKETKQFCEKISRHLNQFSIKNFPLYRIKGEISDFDAFLEYPILLEKIDLNMEDILSNMVRKFSFNENGIIDTHIYIVEEEETKDQAKTTNTLDYQTCIYTIVEDKRRNGDHSDIKDSIFTSTIQWAKEKGMLLKGCAFANTRLITYLDHQERVFLEIFIPIEES